MRFSLSSSETSDLGIKPKGGNENVTHWLSEQYTIMAPILPLQIFFPCPLTPILLTLSDKYKLSMQFLDDTLYFLELNY